MYSHISSIVHCTILYIDIAKVNTKLASKSIIKSVNKCTFFDVLQSKCDWSMYSDHACLPTDDRIRRAAEVKVTVGNNSSNL